MDISKGSVSDLSAYTRMAMLGSMVGIINEVTGMLPSVGHGTLIRPAVSFADGALTSMLEQLILTGELDPREMLMSGALSAVLDAVMYGVFGGLGDGGYRDVGVDGEVRYRQGKPVSPLEKTYEMALDPDSYIQAVVDKYGINLRGSGQNIDILFDPNYVKGPGYVSELYPNTIILGPQALVSEMELANTIAHELNHWRDWLKGGIAPEPPAYRAGNALADYIEGGR